jgi:PiT family inorganic phosphate transporter
VDPATVILVLVVVVALSFDFTNGFHDTANAMATSIATHALRPKVAVALSGVLNLIGAFLSVEVALTVTNAVVHIQNKDGTPKESLVAGGGSALLIIVLAGLIGAIVWNLLTWLLGLPSSSSHALFGGLIGSTIAGLGWGGVNWVGSGDKPDGVVGKVIVPASPRRSSPGSSPRSAPGWCTGSSSASPPATPTRVSAGARSARPRWSRWRTAPTTRRRPWA